MNTKLAKAVAEAMGLQVHTNATLVGEVHQGDWVELSPNSWVNLDKWLSAHAIADRVIDHMRIGTNRHWNGENWVWRANLDGRKAVDADRKTAALMAFCKYRGVAYE